MGQAQGSRWNHNIHFHPLVMNAIQPGATSALDVGTGNGELAGDLRGALPDVTAVDLDARCPEGSGGEPRRDQLDPG